MKKKIKKLLTEAALIEACAWLLVIIIGCVIFRIISFFLN